MTKKIGINRRYMVLRDMHRVMEIEQESFESPWDDDEFKRVLRGRNVIGRVAEHDDDVIGYLIYELFDTRIVIHKLAVTLKFRGYSVGTRLIELLKSKLSINRRREIAIAFPEFDVRCHRFLASQGFVDISANPMNGKRLFRFAIEPQPVEINERSPHV